MPTPTLDKLKHFLSIPLADTSKDGKLGDWLSASRATMATRVGPDEPTTVVDQLAIRAGVAVLSEMPLISITSVIDDDGNTVDITGVKIDRRDGIARRIGPTYCGRADVTYQAGHDPYPHDLELAVYIVAGHLWDTQRGRSGSMQQIHGLDDDAPVGGDASHLVLRGFALPRRAMELARPWLKPRI